MACASCASASTGTLTGWSISLILEKGVYVLHAFQKKSASGIATPKPDIATIKARLQHARQLDEEDDNP